MKKILLISLACLISLSMYAQRCAVLEFKAGAGISQADVEGISAIFNTYFQPAGYTMVERTQIDKVIDEQGFQRTNITQYQMVRLGAILNVSKVVVGDVTIAMGQYNVDVRVVDVQSGTESGKEGATFSPGSSYRSTMQNLAQKLAAQIAITPADPVYTSQSTTSSQPKRRNSVEILYGYLKIYPNELGVFQAEPSSIISQINAQAQYGYNNWRVPTNEELSLMQANNYLGSGEYMTKENKKGIVLLVSDGDNYETVLEKEKERIAAETRQRQLEAQRKREEEQRRQAAREQRRKELIAQGWVDLGLPSRTLWKNQNESYNGWSYIMYSDVFKQYGDSLPSDSQWRELLNYCDWVYDSGSPYWSTDKKYKVIGKNGSYIYLSISGYMVGNGLASEPDQMGIYGYYISSSGKLFKISSGNKQLVNNDFLWGERAGFSVRLVYK